MEASASIEDADAASIALALQLQQEEEQYFALQQAAVVPEGDEDAVSIALAIRMQQQADDEALRGALGVADDEARPESPAGYSYEQLLRLQETVGTVSRGATAASVDALRALTVAAARGDASVRPLQDCCSICRMEWEDDDELRLLPCGHAEHAECLSKWLGVSKCCPLCQQEVVPAAPADAKKKKV
jgi:E3 ubiquitin-protein ligase BIG BROTHER-like protein